MTQNEPPSSAKTPTHRFATGFKSATGEVFVYGALFVAVLLAGVAVVFGKDGYFIGTVVCILCAGHYYPYLDTREVQLGADRRGLYVGGLGLIDWEAIDDLAVIRTPVRRVERAELRAKLNRPWRDALLTADDTPWYAMFMARNWKIAANGDVVVRLEHLKALPDKVTSDLLPFWEERA